MVKSELQLDLSRPFAPDQTHWRIGMIPKIQKDPDKPIAMALAYIDARDVMDRLDECCGIDGWQDKYTHTINTSVCDIGIKIDNEWLWKADGAGATDIEGDKGALSDAFKRAAVRWGIGRYLYGLDAPWVKIDKYKKILPEEIKRLNALLPGGTVLVAVAREEFKALKAVMESPDITTLDLLDEWRATHHKTLNGWNTGWLNSFNALFDERVEELRMLEAA